MEFKIPRFLSLLGKIRSLHTDTLKRLAVKCEDIFMAGQKDQLRFGVDSWSDFRLTSDKPCCEAGDAVYYTASYAKDPLNNYAVKVRKCYKCDFNLIQHSGPGTDLFFPPSLHSAESFEHLPYPRYCDKQGAYFFFFFCSVYFFSFYLFN